MDAEITLTVDGSRRTVTVDTRCGAPLANAAVFASDNDTGQAVNLDAALRSFAEASGRKLGQVAQPLRAALTGSTTSPPIDQTLAALGRDEALARIAQAAA